MAAIAPAVKLIPCPFCGGIPEVHKHYKEDQYNLIHRCKVLDVISLDWNDKGHNEALWNTRVNLSKKE